LIPVAFGREVLAEADQRAAVIADTSSAEAVNGLIEVITATSWIDFSVLTPYVFEKLVADLLTMLGFRVDGAVPGVISGPDFKAIYIRSDPFGVAETETWLVETKLYQHSRVRLETIREIIGAISLEPAGARGLLVTNSQISSIVRDYLSKIEGRAQARLRIMDGVELKRLIAEFPQLVDKYFRGPESGPGVR
jgi:restriction endonuclease Mrr